MSTVHSDSDIEEITPRKALKPRPIRRPVSAKKEAGFPTPTKPRLNKAKGNFATSDCIDIGNSDDSDDDDFFRYKNPAPSLSQEIQNIEKDSTQNTSSTSDALNKSHAAHTNTEMTELIKSDTLINLDIQETDDIYGINDSDDSDNSSVSSNNNIDEPQRPVRAKKRKSSEHDPISEDKQKRSRSVSLTPPPELPNNPAAPVNENIIAPQAIAQAGVPVIDLDSILDTNDADPVFRHAATTATANGLPQTPVASLQTEEAIAPSSELPLSPSYENRQKVQVEFEFVYDDIFISDELLAYVHNLGSFGVRAHNKLLKNLQDKIAVVVFSTDTMERALSAYSSNFAINVGMTNPVLMDGTIRVFPTSSIKSLGNKPIFYIKVYPRSVYERFRDRVTREREKEMLEYRQAKMEMDMLQKARERNGGSESTALLDQEILDSYDKETEGSSANTGQNRDDSGDLIRIKIRDKSGKDVFMRVSTSASVAAIVASYKQQAGVACHINVKLEFDDEKLDPNDCIKDLDIEDDDMLTAHYK